MTITFPTKRRSGAKCLHTSEIRMEIAGMSRSVCESCGRVSVGYVENHISQSVQAHTGDDAATSS